MTRYDRLLGERDDERPEPQYRMVVAFATWEGHYRPKMIEAVRTFPADGKLVGRDLFNVAPGIQRTIAQTEAKAELRGLITLKAHYLATEIVDLLNDAAGWNGADRQRLANERIKTP